MFSAIKFYGNSCSFFYLCSYFSLNLASYFSRSCRFLKFSQLLPPPKYKSNSSEYTVCLSSSSSCWFLFFLRVFCYVLAFLSITLVFLAPFDRSTFTFLAIMMILAIYSCLTSPSASSLLMNFNIFFFFSTTLLLLPLSSSSRI